MEKFQQGRPHPYILPGSSNALPPSYEQVYGGGYPQQIIAQGYCQSSSQYYPTSYPSGPNATSSYPPVIIPAQPHLYNTAISTRPYYPDPRKLVTSSHLSHSTSNNHLTQASTRLDSHEDERQSVKYQCYVYNMNF